MSNLSPAPGTPQTPTKAVLAALGSFAGVFLVALLTALQGRTEFTTMTTDEWLTVIIGALVTAAGVGYGTFKIKNRATGTGA